ncbi:uncharacterized protein RBU33_012370 isoform 2-T13 [Hipposideros larvatus]
MSCQTLRFTGDSREKKVLVGGQKSRKQQKSAMAVNLDLSVAERVNRMVVSGYHVKLFLGGYFIYSLPQPCKESPVAERTQRS